MLFQLPRHIQFGSMITETDDESGRTALELDNECPGKSVNLLLSHDPPPGFDKCPHTVEVDIHIDIMTLEHGQTMLPDQRMPSFDWMQWREIQDFAEKLCLSTHFWSSLHHPTKVEQLTNRDHEPFMTTSVQRPSTCK